MRSINGGEYISKAFQDFCDMKGIKQEFTSPYNLPQNGVSKRMNKTIQEKLRSMLSNAQLSKGFWAKALSKVVHLINRLPIKRLDMSYDLANHPHISILECLAMRHVAIFQNRSRLN